MPDRENTISNQTLPTAGGMRRLDSPGSPSYSETVPLALRQQGVPPRMNLRSVGRTGVKVSELCLGCMMFGGKTAPDDSYNIIDKAIDAGINFLDTANVYSIGRSEEVTGEALKRNGRRNHVVLATKVHGVMGGEDPNMQGNSRRHIIEQ